jgi:hypothetical protein
MNLDTSGEEIVVAEEDHRVAEIRPKTVRPCASVNDGDGPTINRPQRS